MKNCPDLSYYYFNSSTLPHKISIMRSRQTNKICRKKKFFFLKDTGISNTKIVSIVKHYLATVKNIYTLQLYLCQPRIFILFISCMSSFYRNRLFVYIHYSKAPFKTHKQECNDCFLRAEFVKRGEDPTFIFRWQSFKSYVQQSFSCLE